MMIKRHRQDGFSLIEVLIALLIMGGGLLALVRLQMGMLSGKTASVLNDSAIRLAEDKLEALRFEWTTAQVPSPGHDAPVINGIELRRAWSWSTAADGLVSTEITVQWQEPGTGEFHTVLLPARLNRPDLAAQGWLLLSGPPTRETLP